MPSDAEIGSGAEVQPDATPSSDVSTESTSAEETAGSTSAAQSESASDSPITDIENADVPPELAETKKNLLRDYHAKLARVKEENERLKSEFTGAKKDSDALQKLFQQEWFKKALDSEKGRKAGAALSYDLTDEQFDAARTDKRAFLELAKQIAETVVETKFGDKLTRLHQTTESLAVEREFDRVAGKYGEEFKKFSDDGLLDPFTQKGYDYETAFAKAKLAAHGKDGGANGAVAKEAERLILARKGQTTEKTGVGKAAGSRIIKAKNYEDAISKSLEALLAGDKDFKLSRE